MRSVLENNIENIRKVGSSNLAKVYQVRVDQLGSYSVDLQNLEGASPVDVAQFVLSNLHAKQERLCKEADS